MNEEEIIERVNKFINITVLYGKTYGMTCDDLKKYQQVFRGLLDLYKQEKELHKEYEDKFLKLLSSFNRLSELAETLRKENVELLIEKRQKELKIREKIKNLNKEYEEEYKNGQEWEIQDDIQAQISVLEELLEEE